MNLEKYEAQLKAQMENKPFPIPDEELCRRYEDVFVSAVNDVLREEGLISQTLPNNIMPLRDDMKVCGIAFTVKGAPSLDLKDEMQERAKMLEAIQPGNVVVWDTSGDTFSAQWGEIMTMTSKKRGCRGAIVDGGVRDTNKVLEQDFPVFCKYRTSNGMLGRFRTTGWQVPIMIGEVKIFPGDVVFGDIDGVIVIPRAMAYDVLLRAEAIRDNEVGIKKMVGSGMTPTEVVKQGGYF
ncbi:MAG: RraA family protein [Ruminococcaceae bacterium]|nr:RraA family protein [Oscillospiraceae bacterium]